MFTEVLAAVGAISGVVSLGGVAYGLVYWKGCVDTWRQAHEEEHKKYPPGETALMCKTMWDIYIVDALRQRPDLATRKSPYRLTDTAQMMIPEDVKGILCEIAGKPYDKEAWASGWLVVRYLGVERIEKIAKEEKLSVQEAIAILGTYLENHSNNCGQV